MYLIDKDNNRIKELSKKTFTELGFKERDHLQEWIANYPTAFGEELLIIQKEFAGFSDTHERLDLLALDKEGNLVIIENKLDDSGKDVVWQALKYSSYCSGLTKENICKIYQEYLDKNRIDANASDKLVEFFEPLEFEEIILNTGFTQRIIFVAAKFRKEVTSTALWLMNYNLQIQCFKVTPYSLVEQLFLTFEQIIPTPDAEEFMISMAEKAQIDRSTKSELKTRHVYRKEFWDCLLEEMNKKSNLFQNINSSKSNWISTRVGIAGVSLNFVVTRACGRVEIYIDKGNLELNKYIFDYIENNKAELEKNFTGEIIWERLDNKRACRIKAETNGNIYDKESWDDMIQFMIEKMISLESSFKKYIPELSDKIKEWNNK